MKSSMLGHLTVIATAVVAALVTWGIVSLVGIDLDLRDAAASDSVGARDVLVTTIVVGLVAWPVHVLMVRRNLARWWPFLGSTVLSISMVGPGYLAEGAGSILALVAMHFIVAIIIITGFAMQERKT